MTLGLKLVLVRGGRRKCDRMKSLIKRLISHSTHLIARELTCRGKRFDINDRDDITQVYMERYYLLFKDRPSWFPFNLFLHHICRSDDQGLHDHPWPWASLILRGGYWEDTAQGRYWRGAGSIRLRRATFAHRIDIDKEKADDETWTLFVVGPRTREWGYLTPAGWIHWKEKGNVKPPQPYKDVI